MTKSSVIEKIKSLLVLSSDPNTTEHERQLAFSRARHLIDRYTISEQELDPNTKLEIVWEPFKPSDLYKISETLTRKLPFIVNEIGMYFGCFVAIRSHVLHFVGYPHNIEVAQYAANVLLKQGVDDFKKAYRDRLRQTREIKDPHEQILMGAFDLITFQEAYWDGFLTAMVERFRKSTEESQETALTIYDPIKQLRGSMNSIEFRSLYGAAAEGLQSGRNAQLHKPIETQTKGNLLK